MLDCICLRWQRTDGKRNELASAREFGLENVNSNRGSVHIVDRNTMIPLVAKAHERSHTHFEMAEKTETWENEAFYVNGFISIGIEQVQFVESEDFLKSKTYLSEHLNVVLRSISIYDPIMDRQYGS